MRRFCWGIAGIILGTALAGCSDTGVKEGPVPFKGTNTEPYNAMKNQMVKGAQTQAFDKKPSPETNPGQSPPTGESKPGESKPVGETKPAGESKPAESKPAESKPAESKPAESKPAAKKG
jgi:hypothetical protein